MKVPLFSVITPVYNHSLQRYIDTLRCLRSIETQTEFDFEHIVVDQTEDKDFRIQGYGKLKVFRQPHVERLFALREGFEQASGEWFCLCDSDDIYMPHYLEEVKKMIQENPEYKLFNFGSLHIQPNKSIRVRDAFKPKKLDLGHEVFGGGNIVNGTFVFHRSVWERLGDFPMIENLWSPWDFSIAAQEEFPELKVYFMVDHEDEPEKIARELGNPFGQDFYLFYKFTRKFWSLPSDKHLYGVYCK